MVDPEMTPLQQWQSKLFNTQVATYILVEDLKGKLEFCLRVGNGRWSETYNCLGTLDLLGDVIKGAGGKWKADPVKLIQELVRRIRAFQEPILDPYINRLALLEHDFTILMEHPVH
jgi:hypothetical protein